MSEFIGIWAEIHLAKHDARSWWSARVRGSAWQDWTGILEDAGHPGRPAIDGTVEEIFEDARKVGQKRTLFKLSREAGSLRLRAVLSLDDDLATCAELCVALRATGEFGGTGDVVVLSMTDEARNTYVSIGKGSSRCTKATAARLASVSDSLTDSLAKDDSRDTPGAALGRATSKMVEDNIERARAAQRRPAFRALHARMLDALVARCPPKAITLAAKDWRRPYRVKPPSMKTVEQIVDVLRKRLLDEEWSATHFAPLALLSVHDPSAAESIAYELLELEPNWNALLALAESKEPRARELLLRLYAEGADREKSAPMDALVHMRDMGVSERILPQLEELLRDLPSPYDVASPRREELLRLCYILCAQSDSRGFAAVAGLYRDCQREMARREAAIEVKRRETWEAFDQVRVVIFQRGTAWWARKLVSSGKGNEQWQLGAAAAERDARSTAVEGEAPAVFAEQLGKRLLFDGKPPREGWVSPGPLRGFAGKVEAILKRRGL